MMMMLSLLLFTLLFVSTSISQELGDFSPCGEERVMASVNNNHQHQVVYNSVNNEYFVAWIEEVDGGGPSETSVVGRRYDNEGKPVGGKIPIYPYGIDSNGKHFPYVAYNPKRNLYTVLFEYDYAEGDVDIYGGVIYADGTIAGYFPVAATTGIDDRPSLAYNPDIDEFLFTFENDVYLNGTNATNNFILVGRMNGLGIPLPVESYDPVDPYPYLTAIQVPNHDSRPNLAYNKDSKQFLLTFSIDSDQPPLKIVVGVSVNSQGIVNPNGTIIGSLALRNGTRVSCHNSQVRYAPNQQYYFVIYEVDVNGNESYLTDVIASPVDPATGGVYGFITLSGNLPRNRNPSFDYASRTDDFVVAFEADIPGSNQFNIRGTVIGAETFIRHTEIVYINRVTNIEHHPQVAYNSKEGKVIAIWNNGNEPEDIITRNIKSDPVVERDNLVQLDANKKYEIEFASQEDVSVQKRQVKSFNFPKTPIYPIIEESPSLKRQATVSPLKGTILCASSSTTLAADVQSGNSDGSNKTVVAISVVVAIFGVVIIALVAALVYIFVIRPRRESSRANAAYKFDPERESES